MAETDRPEEYEQFFTIFIPSYNRAYRLQETFSSIEKLSFPGFEVLVIDDGSTDETYQVVESWRSSVSFPVRYFYKVNGGKCSAHNEALKHADGFMLFPLDAGDLVLSDALDHIKKHWEDIPEATREHFAGICGLCLKDDGTVSGRPFDTDIIDSDYNEIYSRSAMKDEKRRAIRLSVLRDYPYPVIDGEKYVRPSLILRRLSHRYKLRFVNTPLQIERREPDGIRNNSFMHNFHSPKGQRLYFQEEITLNDRYHSAKKLYRLHVHFIRFSLLAGVGLRDQVKETKHPVFWSLAVLKGLIKWKMDLAKAKALGIL